ncbi:SpoIIE family protein phosphatase [Actinomadura vinacea]|uniref:SpoIIE family protein phosphatase n=1 Tax=Actinomadura vinacea TaxID=115336 RepID=A0ABN3JY53_9ACTN
MAPNESSITGTGKKRLRVLASVSRGLSDSQVLECALDQAVAHFHALGGTVHWGGLAGSHEPRLVLTCGLPRTALQAWDEVGDVVARTQSDGVLVRRPVATPTRSSTVMVTAVPLRNSETTLGVLSVLTDGPREPTGDQRAFLEGLASWLADRLALSSPDSGVRQGRWWQEESTDSQLRQALNAVRVGSWEWDIRTGGLAWDEAGLTVMGIEPSTGPYNIDTWVDIIHPDDMPRVMAATEKAVRTRSIYEIEYRACRPDGTVGWMQARGRVVMGEDGEPARMVGTVWDTTEGRLARESVDHALRYMTDAFLAVDGDWRITFVNLSAERLLAPTEGLHGRMLWDLPAGTLPGLEAQCRQAVAEGEPASFDVQWPTDHRWYHVRLVPVPAGLTLYLTDVTERRIREAERRAAEHAAAERTAWIQKLTRTLGEAVGVRDVVRVIAERVLPRLGATALAVLALEDNRLRVIGSAGYSRDLLGRSEEQGPVDRSALADVFEGPAPVVIGTRAEYRERYPDLARLTAGEGMDGWVLLPLAAPEAPTGCCVIPLARSRRFTGEERTLLALLSGLIAQAVARARLYDTAQTRAQALQRLLLPRDLPAVPGVLAAARYLPASSSDVGGDWYDVIPLSAERVALVIGDVMGHGLAEAATMGRLRTAVRTLADLELPPGELLTHLNDLVSDLGADYCVTCLYAVYDPTTGACTLVSAGHPMPVVVHPDGTVEIPDAAPNPPLGAAEPPFDTVDLHLPERSLLVLYTDGLVESASYDIDSGLADLTRILTAGRRQDDLDSLCEAVITAMRPTRQPATDDAALLIASANRLSAEDVATWELPEDPIAAGQARKHVREQLDAWDLDDLVMTTELVASELVGNVIRHARGPVRLRLLRSRTLICEVSDGSLTTPRIRRAADTDEGGRGLQLIAALCQRWGARYTTDGKSIWTEQAIPG